MESKILFGNEARQAMLDGIAELADAVTTTLGPLGHTVVINRGYNLPYVTKDGVTVARAYETDDVKKGMGAMLVKLASAKTCDEAGDGTTTTVLLARRIIEYGMNILNDRTSFPKGVNVRNFRKGMEDGLQMALEKLLELSHKIGENDFDTIRKIAMVSANGDEEIAEMIVEAIGKVGKDGVITVEESPNHSEMSVEVTTGFHWNKGISSHLFITDPERLECVLDNPYILILSNRINFFQELTAPVQTAYAEKRPLLIVAPDISPDALKFLTINVQKGILKGAFVKAPGYGQIQNDLIADFACRVGGTVVETGDNASPMHFGSCNRVIISLNQTIVVGGSGESEKVNERVQGIKYQLENCSNTFDKEKMRERIAYLTGGTAVLYVGANSEVELKERKDRVDDAVSAVKSALEEGYVAGCGVCASQLGCELISYSEEKEGEYASGINCIAFALMCVNSTVLGNAGITTLSESFKNVPELNEEAKEFTKTVDPVTEEVIDVLEKGIIDPTKVLRCALTNSVSVAIQFLNTDCLIATPVESK